LSVAVLNLRYQFWVHTRYLPELGWLALSLYNFGLWLENRPAALWLELLRLALNLSLLFCLQQARLLPLMHLGWALVVAYSLASGCWLWRMQPQTGAELAL
jgi:hypothetical protein